MQADRADAEDRDLRRVQDRREAFDPETAEVGHGERPTLQIIRRGAALLGERGEPGGLTGKRLQAERAGAADDWNQQAARRVDRKAEVDAPIARDGILREQGVQLVVLRQRAGDGEEQ